MTSRLLEQLALPEDIQQDIPKQTEIIILKDDERDKVRENENHICLIKKKKPAFVIELMCRNLFSNLIQTEIDSFNEEILLSSHIIKSQRNIFKTSIIESLSNTKFKKYAIENFKTFDFCCKETLAQAETNCLKYINEFTNNSSTKSNIYTIVNELLTNALYNAPLAVEKNWAKYIRVENKNTKFPSNKKAQIKIGSSKHYFFIECTDPFGSLNPFELIASIQRTYKLGIRNSIRKDDLTGANIGMRLVFDKCISVSIFVDSFNITKILCIIPNNKSNKYLTQQPKCFHLLYMGEKMTKLNIKETNNKGLHQVLLSGKIDEDSDFSSVDLKSDKSILFDFKNIVGINSCGIREWVKLMKTIPEKAEVTTQNCSREIIDQLNMIDGFFPPQTFVKSFYVPYYCEECDEQTNILIEIENENSPTPEYKEETECRNCKKEAEIDVMVNKFFRFLK